MYWKVTQRVFASYTPRTLIQDESTLVLNSTTVLVSFLKC